MLKKIFASTLALFFMLTGSSQSQETKAAEEYPPGIWGTFLNWGLYAVPEGIFPDGTKIGGFSYAEWYQIYSIWNGKGDWPHYHSFVKEFRGKKFDADALVKQLREAGCGSITFTAKFHDGFAMWNTKVKDYRQSTDPRWENIFDISSTPLFKEGNKQYGGPYGPGECDPVVKLKEACDKYGIKLTFYYSHIKDWHQAEADQGDLNSTSLSLFPEDLTLPANDRNHKDYWEKMVIPQVKELIEFSPARIGFDTPKQLSNFDMPGFSSQDAVVDLAELLLENNIQPGQRMGITGEPKTSDGESNFLQKWTFGYHADREYESVSHVFGKGLQALTDGTRGFGVMLGLPGDGDLADTQKKYMRKMRQWFYGIRSWSEYDVDFEKFDGYWPTVHEVEAMPKSYMTMLSPSSHPKMVCKGNKLHIFRDNDDGSPISFVWNNYSKNPPVKIYSFRKQNEIENGRTDIDSEVTHVFDDANKTITFDPEPDFDYWYVITIEFAHDILPEAHSDTYKLPTDKFSSLDIDKANGVMSNDFDYSSRNTLIVRTARKRLYGDIYAPTVEPKYGTVVLNEDGSFTYTLLTKYQGLSGVTDTFSYKLWAYYSDDAAAADTLRKEHAHSKEVTVSINLYDSSKIDTDGDGLSDYDEIHIYGTDPNNPDTDGDGLKDGEDDDPLVPRPADYATVEYGNVSVNHVWTPVTFKNTFKNPVVIAGSPSYNGGQQCVARIRNVTATGFEIRIQEWNYLNVNHVVETIPYIVVEKGRNEVAAGVWVEAGTLQTSKCNSYEPAVSFSKSFAKAPVVMTSVVSNNDSSCITTRMHSISTNSFKVLIEEEENEDQVHSAETVSYIAWGTNTVSGKLNGGSLNFEVGKTARSYEENFKAVNFAGSHSSEASMLLQMQTNYGGDTSSLRVKNQTASSIEVMVEEETSKDTELNHTTESVGFIVISKSAN